MIFTKRGAEASMDLPDRIRRKIDVALYQRLYDADEQEQIRVIAQLSSGKSEMDGDAGLFVLNSSNSAMTREERRAQRIDGKRERMHRLYRGVFVGLEAMGVRVHGGDLMETVVLEGSAEALVRALDIEQVAKAYLDRPMGIV